MSMSRFDEALWAAANSGDIPALGDLVKNVEGKPAEAIVVETVILNEGGIFDRFAGQLVNVGPRSVLRVFDDRGSFTLLAEPTTREGIYHLIGSVPSSDGRWKRVERTLVTSSPDLTPCFLNHDDFADLGTSLSEFGAVEVRAMSARHRLHTKSVTTTWQKLESHLRPDPQTAILEAEEAETSVRTLRLHISEVLDVHLRRLSGATYYGGDFGVFSSIILARLADAAFRRRNLMHGRARQVAQPTPAPIQITLPVPAFKSASDTARVIEELAAPQRLSHAVLHRNPYLQVSVIDHSDGSNFDVLVTRPDTIEVQPGFRASAGALTALVQQLTDRFAAEDIRERKVAEPVSLYSLMSG